MLGALVSAGGHVAPGIWADDADNWERAFGTPPHEHSKVAHSLYWRLPPFT